MRRAPLLAVLRSGLALLAAPALHAQTCVPDPTPPASYYPLNVGDEWIYHLPRAEGEVVFLSRRVLREETVGGTAYVVDQVCRTGPAGGTMACEPERRVRFDTATASVFSLRDDGVEQVAVDRLSVGFSLLPFGSCMQDLGQTVRIGGTTYTVPRVKAEYAIDFGPPALAAGVGPTGVSQVIGGQYEFSDRFEYARVGGVEYGVRPVAGESGATPGGVLALATAPNPTSGALRLALTLPEAQTVAVEAFDALGRRVWQLTAALGAGAQTLTVDASAWAPGVYVVRVAAGQATATARVVRR